MAGGSRLPLGGRGFDESGSRKDSLDKGERERGPAKDELCKTGMERCERDCERMRKGRAEEIVGERETREGRPPACARVLEGVRACAAD